MRRICLSLVCFVLGIIGCESGSTNETPMPELDSSTPAPDVTEMVPDVSGSDIDAGSEVDQSQCETETCDGQDNDCDGLVDETTSGENCVVDGAQGECEQGTLICADGALTCEMTQMPNAEVCDGLDNDCDGIIDDQVAGEEGMPCTIEGALGLCAQGVELCVDGALTCVPNFVETVERCNDLDDDCDGEVDEMVSENGMPCTTSYSGVCNAGFYECGEGINGRNELLCVPTIAPAEVEETCNAADDDCDGSIDEGLGLGVACERGMGACFVQGVTTCTETGEVDCAAQAGMPGAEVCNGIDAPELDEDCDGRFNENTSSAPDTCSVGEGACVRTGRFVCTETSPGSFELACDAIAAVGQDEVCNGVSDDCDDTIDENVAEVGQACISAETGVCGSGTYECRTQANQTALYCRPNVTPGTQVEVFNCLDDDCDGEIDEDAPGVGAVCPGGGLPNSYCAFGRRLCVGDINPTIQCVSNQPRAELCDGVDDDCDGNIDEAVEGFGDLCTMGLSEDVAGSNLCNYGVQLCQEITPGEFALICVSSTVPRCEVGGSAADEDCDGVTDEATDRFCGEPELALERHCLGVAPYAVPGGGIDDGLHIGVRHAIDSSGEVHFSRVSNAGEMIYSRINAKNMEARHVVIGVQIEGTRASDVELLGGDTPVVAFTLPPPYGPLVFFSDRAEPTDPSHWRYDQVDPTSWVSNDVSLVEFEGKLRIFYRKITDTACETERRAGDRSDFACASSLVMGTLEQSGWVLTTVNQTAGGAAGFGVTHAISDDDSTLYVAHGDALNGNLVVEILNGGQWSRHTEPSAPVVNNQPAAQGTSGFRPSIAVMPDGVVAIHGAWVGREIDNESDSGRLIATRYNVDSDSWFNESLSYLGDNVGGGQSVANLSGDEWIFARERFRTALAAADLDALNFGRSTEPRLSQELESFSDFETRHLFNNLQLSSDAFGLPFMSFSDQPGGVCQNFGGVEICPIERVCFYRAIDTDGDQVPDFEEDRRGTNPDVADTDGDGRSDGAEILEFNSDPLVAD